MADTTFSFLGYEFLKEAFSTAAQERASNGPELLRDFMRHVVEQHGHGLNGGVSLVHEIQVGIDAANAGDVLSAEEVEAEAVAWRGAIRSGVVGSLP